MAQSAFEQQRQRRVAYTAEQSLYALHDQQRRDMMMQQAIYGKNKRKQTRYFGKNQDPQW